MLISNVSVLICIRNREFLSVKYLLQHRFKMWYKISSKQFFVLPNVFLLIFAKTMENCRSHFSFIIPVFPKTLFMCWDFSKNWNSLNIKSKKDIKSYEFNCGNDVTLAVSSKRGNLHSWDFLWDRREVFCVMLPFMALEMCNVLTTNYPKLRLESILNNLKSLQIHSKVL